jgi:hypothetical protein
LRHFHSCIKWFFYSYTILGTILFNTQCAAHSQNRGDSSYMIALQGLTGCRSVKNSCGVTWCNWRQFYGWSMVQACFSAQVVFTHPRFWYPAGVAYVYLLLVFLMSSMETLRMTLVCFRSVVMPQWSWVAVSSACHLSGSQPANIMIESFHVASGNTYNRASGCRLWVIVCANVLGRLFCTDKNFMALFLSKDMLG